MSTLLRALLTLSLSLALSGCDAASDALGGGDGGDGALTICQYSYAGDGVAGDFGEPCATDADCAHGTCLQPGADGNITNEVFAFCTRACDCETSGGVSAPLASSDPDYTCVYPGGCFIGQSQGAWRHAGPKCGSVSDCTAIDSRYTDCEYTDRLTVLDDKTCGSITRVCQAHN